MVKHIELIPLCIERTRPSPKRDTGARIIVFVGGIMVGLFISIWL